MDHSARVVSEQELLATLWSRVDLDQDQPGEADWTIFSSRPLPPGAVEQKFRDANGVGCSGHIKGHGRCLVVLDRITRERMVVP